MGLVVAVSVVLGSDVGSAPESPASDLNVPGGPENVPAASEHDGTFAEDAPAEDAARDAGRAVTSTGSASLGPANAMPASLLQLPPATAGAIVVDLGANRLYLYRRQDNRIELAQTHYVAIGKNGANKEVEGDERTPVGAYFVTRHIPDHRLPELYGIGAFPVNYPNLWDRRLGRTGSGIWIHGMPRDQETRPARSSRGCLALKNSGFATMVSTVETRRTPVLISESIAWRTPQANEDRRRAIGATVEAWRQAWESLDTNRYLGFYAADFRFGRMDRRAWSRHKQRVNAHKRFIRIRLERIGIYQYPGEPDLVLVDFQQSYQSSNFNGTSQKRQYWRRQADGGWKIVHEGTATE